MNTVIDPFWIYIIDVFDTLKCISWFIAFILSSIIFIKFNNNVKINKLIIFLLFIFLILGIFIPSYNTMTDMILASEIKNKNLSTSDEIIERANKNILLLKEIKTP